MVHDPLAPERAHNACSRASRTRSVCIERATRQPMMRRANTYAGDDGTMTITSPTTADVTLPGGRQTKIQRYLVP